jgi:ethanolamine utilization protein EutA
MHDGPDDHEHITDEDIRAFAQSIWEQENVELTTVGIDIGSSTSHLLFAKLFLQRQTQGLSSRFETVRREVIWRSAVTLTPFLPDGTIDAQKLDHFIRQQYELAGLERDSVDTGAVILTGEAIKRRNARAIDELLAEQGGRFVCATAGHRLECTLAAHGSGAVDYTRRSGQCVLHVDIGGGTTKLALIDRGNILGVSAFSVGGRVIAQDETGRWTRVDDTARLAAEELGIELSPGALADPTNRMILAERLAKIVCDQIIDVPLDSLGQRLLLTEALQRSKPPQAISFSGGVSEYLFGRETAEFGDIAKMLAESLQKQFQARLKVPIIDPGQGIRATVIGASQFTVQVSGKTIYFSDSGQLNIHNIPVVHLGNQFTARSSAIEWTAAILSALARHDIATGRSLALAFSWNAPPEYSLLRACAEGICGALGCSTGQRENLLLLMIDGDVGRSLGCLLREEMHFTAPLVSLDGVRLQEFDYVDIGGLVDPPGVVPVIIKSLVFP